MAELELNYTVIQECIVKMQALPDNCPSATRPAASGEGQSITEMEKLADLYSSFFNSMTILTASTAEYLEHMVRDFKKADGNTKRDVYVF